jgi:glucans biosynthesis protein C
MQPSTRLAYLDWLRILAILGVLFFHSAMPFVAVWDFHIKNKETSHVLLEMNDFMHMFRMPLLFFISGTVSYFMLRNRTGGGFIGLRFTRLFIPLLLGILVIVPPQVYMERLTEGYKGNFWQFYPSIFKGIYPKGNGSWHHLWFIAYLLVYDVLCAPLFVWIMSEKGKTFVQHLAWLAKGKRIYFIMLPGILVYAFMTIYFPETHALVNDPAYALYWLFFLIPGFLCIANPALMDSIANNRRTSFTIAFLSLCLINYLRWNDLEPWDIKVLAYTCSFCGLRALCGWTIVLTLIGYGKIYLDRPHPALKYLNEAVYPFYILHQTVIIILTYYVVQVDEPVGIKYAYVVIGTFMYSMCIYHLFIRPFRVTRFLFGMRKKM